MVSIVVPILIIIFQIHYEQWLNNESSSITKVEKSQDEQQNIILPTVQQAEIINVTKVYPAINKGNCLNWPNQEMKVRGGIDKWDSFYPKKGDVGIIIAKMNHCHSGDEIYLLKIEQYYVPIMYNGIHLK